MPYTEEEKRLRNNDRAKRWREKHREEIREKDKEKYQNNKEKKKEYREKHKEAIAETKKEYYKKNKEERLEQQKEYGKTENGKRSRRINGWKMNGLIVDDYNIIYDRWLNSEKCEMCLCEYKITKKGYLNKCMEHSHTTGEFRSICCMSCNQRIRWIDKKNKRVE